MKSQAELLHTISHRFPLQREVCHNTLDGPIYSVAGKPCSAVTLPGGTVIEDSWRTSVMWVQEEGNWKIVHFHASELLPE